jgi:hypothetical protein
MSYILTRVCDISFLFQIIIHSRTQSRSYARSATRGSGKIQTGYHKNITQLQIEHAQCLTGYHVFMVSGLDFAWAPRRVRRALGTRMLRYMKSKYQTVYSFFWDTRYKNIIECVVNVFYFMYRVFILKIKVDLIQFYFILSSVLMSNRTKS